MGQPQAHKRNKLFSQSIPTSDQRYAVLGVSDVHLLHPRTPTPYIVENFKRYVLNDAALEGVRLMVIVGDFFDRMGSLGSGDVQRCLVLIDEILKACVRRGIILRVLNGTPSHDRDQSISFETVRSIGKYQLDFRYINTIEIETIGQLGASVLYVPDEMHADTADTLAEVNRVFVKAGVERVDYAFMHGVFEFQIPEVSNPHIKHDSAAYLEKVNRHIFIGHDHKHKINGRIGVQGSFDRCGHGEEEDKGFLKSWFNAGHVSWEFVKNSGALQYKTITCHLKELEESILFLLDKVSGLNDGSHVRVFVSKTHPLFSNASALEEKRPGLNWRVETSEKKRLRLKEPEILRTKDAQIIISPGSIETLLRKRLRLRGIGEGVAAAVIKKVKELS